MLSFEASRGNPVFTESEALSVNALDKIFPEGTYKLLKTKRVDGYRVQRGKR